MRNKRFQDSIIKMMLALMLVFTLLPMQTLAETNVETDELTETEIVSEDVEVEDESAADDEDFAEEENESTDTEDVEPSGTEEKEEILADEETVEETDEADEEEYTPEESEEKEAVEEVSKEEEDEEEQEEAEELEEPEDFPLTIMHMNDTHAHVENMPKMATAVKQIRAEKENNLLLHAGDVFSGTLYFNVHSGQADVALFNLMKLDAMVFGNHEFDVGAKEGGQKSLSEFVQAANFPLLGTNIDFSADPFMAGFVNNESVVRNAPGGIAYQSIIIDVNGEEVGLFGLTTEDTPDIASPMSVTFKHYKETAKNAVANLEAEGVNKIIALTHLGYDTNPAVGNDLLLGKVEGIDVVVGGHSHTKVTEPKMIEQNENGEKKDPTLVVQAFQYAEYLGELNVVFDEEGVIKEHDGGLIELKGYAEDSEALGVLAAFKDEVVQLRDEESGATAVKTLVNPRDEGNSVRANETELGNLVTDAMLAKAKEKFSETVIAVQNGGGIRAPIEEGPITNGEIIQVLPFGNDPVVAEVTGAELKEIFEHSVRLFPEENGGFLHISGMRLIYDSAKEPGNRVIRMDLLTDGKYVEIEPTQTMLITTNQFTAEGGDGFDTFKKIYDDGRVKNIGEIDWEQLRDYMVDEKYLGGKVDAEIEGRMINLVVDDMPDDLVEPEDPEEPGGDDGEPGDDDGEPGDDDDKPGGDDDKPGDDGGKPGDDDGKPGDDGGKPGDDGGKPGDGDGKPGDDGDEPGDDGGKPGDDGDEPGDDGGKPGDDGDEPGDGDGKPGDDGDKPKTNNGNGTTIVELEDGNKEGGQKLPSTATTIYTTLLIGSILLIAGGIIFFYRKYKVN